MLTWRDIQYLLVYSSNSDYPKDDHWQVNGAGLNVSHWYGMGIIDGAALVNRARNWVTVPPRNNCSINVTSKLDGGEIATSDNSLVVKIHVENCKLSALEHVQAITSINIHDGTRKEISILLASPAGTKSILLPFRSRDNHKDGFHLWPFMTILSWGERSNGDWIFSIQLKERGRGRVELEALELVLYGTDSIPSSVQAVPSKCHSQCLKGCSQEGAQFCDSCKHFRIATSLECVESCPDGTYVNGNICHACPPLCAECSDRNSCNHCFPNTYWLSTGSCSSSCPTGTYATSTKVCTLCHQSCLSCNGSLSTDCTSCQSQFLLVNQRCVVRDSTSCSEGEYFDHRSHECHLCHETCASCIGRDDNQCIRCYNNSRLSPDGMCIDSRHSRSCNSGQYLNNSNFECTNCPTHCSNCSDSETCSSCHDGYFLIGGNCRSICPQNTTTDVQNQLCIETKCHPSCLNCSGHEPTHCISCHQGQLLFDGQCLNKCPPQFYEHRTSCHKCHFQCRSCNGPLEDQCLSCSSGRFLLNQRCVVSCPIQTYASENQCLNCIENCLNCSKEFSCDLCGIKYYLLSSNPPKCVNDCPEYYFSNSTTRTCRRCPPNCKKCNNNSACRHCQDGYVYYAPNRSCEKQCPSGYYSSETTCIPCEFPCTTCSGTSLNCSSCSTGMALHQKSQECRKCCNPDEILLQCCDCDQDNRYCVLSTFATSATIAQTTKKSSISMQLIAGTMVFLLLILLVTIAIISGLYRRKGCNQSNVSYQVVSNEEAFDKELSASEID